MSTALLFDKEVELLKTTCINIGSVRSLTMYLLASHGEWDQLVSIGIDPTHYDNHRSFADDYLVTSMMSKNPRIPTTWNRTEVALSKFLISEAKCRETNSRLDGVMYNADPIPPSVAGVIHHARELIRSWLGPLTRSDLDWVERGMSFGPGATTSLSGVVSQGKKYSSRPVDATPRVACLRTFCFPDLWKANCDTISIVEGSRLVTVPKNAKVDRVICIEPDLNIFVQKGIGKVIRHKLLQSGLDLSTQAVNQKMAENAHTTGYCTVDLSAASDTISRSLVWFLLPDRWCELLHFARVDKTQMPDGTYHSFEKWSSMGNGYTFELETLIFAAVVKAAMIVGCIHGDVAIYGDDLVFPDEIRSMVIEVLEFLGFSTNREKTFGKGRFHESCGTDWFDGFNVRPFFLRSDNDDFESVMYLYANQARRWASRRNGGLGTDVRILPFWLRCFHAVKPQDRHLIPDGFGDVGFAVDHDNALQRVSFNRDTRSWSFTYRARRAVEKVVSPDGVYLSFLNGNITSFGKGREALRGRYHRPSTAIGTCFAWPDLGRWL